MLRKVGLMVVSCAALLAVGSVGMPGMASASLVGCNNLGYSLGIYNSGGTIKKFDLNTSAGGGIHNANKPASISASVGICGSDPSIPKLYKQAALTNPNIGEIWRCGRKNPGNQNTVTNAAGTVVGCDTNEDGNKSNDNQASGTFIGTATVDSYCYNDGGPAAGYCAFLYDDGIPGQLSNYTAASVIKYNADGNSHCSNTSTKQIQCAQSIGYPFADFPDIKCTADYVIGKSSTTSPDVLTIYQPLCVNTYPDPDLYLTSDGTASGTSIIYIDNIDNVSICKYGYADPNGDGYGVDAYGNPDYHTVDTCPVTGTKWVFQNGQGNAKWSASTTLTTGVGPSANSNIQAWNP